MSEIKKTVPGLSIADAQALCDMLQSRLHSMNDLHLTLKHAHWNVVGPTFIGVHEMLDPQVELVRGFADVIAERMAALGASPNGVPGDLTRERDWEDYTVGRASVREHLEALDRVYGGIIGSNRKGIALAADIDPITEDILIGQTNELEKFQWFIRAHLENQA